MSDFDLSKLAQGIETPGYARRNLRPRLLHLGFGAFARAHWMGYHQDLLNKHPELDWGVIVTDLNYNADRFGQLEDNDLYYSVLEYSDTVDHTRVIGSILGTAHPARNGVDGFFAPFLFPDLAVVSLTVTEKGYCLAGGELDMTNADIVHDFADPRAPLSAIGALVEALRRRRDAGLDAFTILSLDNLPANGKTCEKAVMSYARKLDADLAAWIERNVTFPCSMVDRIVPALTDESRALLRERLGFDDPNGIVGEPFRQWVIEDNFVKGRPDWDEVGAQFAADVEPFENMKLRMLNGTHSTMAYLGYLSGYETIAETIADPDFRTLVYDAMTREIAPTVTVDADLMAYRDALIHRYSNGMLKHRTWQIAMDGSQKLPQRLLNTIRDRLEMGEPSIRLCLGVAAWMRYVSGEDENGEEIDVRDPYAERLVFLGKQAKSNPDAMAAAYLGMTEIFGEDLPNNARFRKQVTAHLSHLLSEGAKATVHRVVHNGEALEEE
ncbi:MAG: mannitol dehydrogenase family protein [Alphaproteobacteria bacterium]|nr:mannitol dehydrogenase family protein [Alphaproteobacteria bacterium]